MRRLQSYPDHRRALAPLLLESMAGRPMGQIFSQVCLLASCTSREIGEPLEISQAHIGTTLNNLEGLGLVKRLGYVDKKTIIWGLSMPWLFLTPDHTHSMADRKVFEDSVANFRRGPENYKNWYNTSARLFRLGDIEDMPPQPFEVFPQLFRHDYGFFEVVFPHTDVRKYAEQWTR